MRSYQVGLEYYFREIGQKLPAGSVIELRQGDAERYMVSHPGLLRPLPVTTQARPQAVRSAPAAPAAQPVTTAETQVESPAAPAAEPEPPAPADVPAFAKPSAESAESTTPAGDVEAKPKGKARAKK